MTFYNYFNTPYSRDQTNNATYSDGVEGFIFLFFAHNNNPKGKLMLKFRYYTII